MKNFVKHIESKIINLVYKKFILYNNKYHNNSMHVVSSKTD